MLLDLESTKLIIYSSNNAKILHQVEEHPSWSFSSNICSGFFIVRYSPRWLTPWASKQQANSWLSFQIGDEATCLRDQKNQK